MHVCVSVCVSVCVGVRVGTFVRIHDRLIVRATSTKFEVERKPYVYVCVCVFVCVCVCVCVCLCVHLYVYILASLSEPPARNLKRNANHVFQDGSRIMTISGSFWVRVCACTCIYKKTFANHVRRNASRACV